MHTVSKFIQIRAFLGYSLGVSNTVKVFKPYPFYIFLKTKWV